MDRINLDFETYSEANLKEVGAHRYAMDPSTDVLSLAYSFRDEPPKLWVPGMDMPKDLFGLLSQGYLTYGWNVTFEFAIWKYVCVKKLGWPEVPNYQWRDTQAVALLFAHPMSLGYCGEVMDLEIQKDKRGEQLINLLSKPQKITKSNPYKRFTPSTHPHLFEEMYEYNIQDVNSERAILDAFPWDLPDSEQEIFLHTLEKNDAGIPIDTELVDSIVEKVDEYLVEVSQIVPIITDGAINTINQGAKIIEWCEIQGYEIPNFQADTVTDALADPDIENYPNVKSLLEIRQLAGKSSIKKFVKIAAAVCKDGRIRNCLKYHKATTGREGGRLLQPQNLPRADVEFDKSGGEEARAKATELLVDMFKNDPLEEIMAEHENVLYVASSLIRPSICAEDSKEFIVSDYSQIENRMLCWLAGQEDVLDLIRDGMDTYKDMASHLYNIDYSEIPKEGRRRRHGKLTILGGGYGMGYKKFWDDCVNKQKFDITLKEAKHTIDTFRERYNEVKNLWYGLQDAAIEATINQGNITGYGVISFMHDSNHLYMILPNGKQITYPKAWVEPNTTPWGEVRNALFHMGVNSKTKKWTKHNLTPGRLTENASQGASREILFEAVLDLKKKYGDKIILTVHDEVVLEVEKGTVSLEEVNEVLCNRSSTWDGLPLNASGFTTRRYHK
jgi:DNA polymerase